MSADNWRVCPKCKKTNESKGSLYGKVSEEEYLDSLNQLKVDEETLREDYEIGIDERGEFYVDYSCRCQTCGFGFHYKHSQMLELTEDSG